MKSITASMAITLSGKLSWLGWLVDWQAVMAGVSLSGLELPGE